MDPEKDKKAVDIKELNQAKKLFNSLIKIENSIFYLVNKINKNLVPKSKRTVCAKDKVFIKLYTEVQNKNYLYLDKVNQPILPLTMPFIEKRKNIDPLRLY